MRKLYTLHNQALQTLHMDLENQATLEPTVLLGTPGTLLIRKNADGLRFYSRQFYDASGKQREAYVAGPVGSTAAEQRAEALKLQIDQSKAISKELRLLGREGYQLSDAKTYNTLASLHNHGLFRAGAVLIGSHAFGVLLNQLGVRAARYATEDIDLARGESLSFETPLKQSLLELLQGSGLPFVEVTGFRAKSPPTQWKERGRSRFHLDLLAPSPDDSFQEIPVPELGAYATGVPYLRYLISAPQNALLSSRNGCFQVKAPTPERFAVHKLLVAQRRPARSQKSLKDLDQSAILLAALGEHHPGAIEEALDDAPVSAMRDIRRSIAQLQAKLEGPHPQAWEAISSAL